MVSTVVGRDDMCRTLITELREVYNFLQRNSAVVVILGSATLFIAIDRYYWFQPQWLSSLVYFLALPVLTIVVLLRRNPLDFGLHWGHYRIWGFHVALVMVIGLPILYATSHIDSLHRYYTMTDFNWVIYSLETIAQLLALEFLLRGYMLFGLKERFHEGGIFIQMVPFVLLHLGKPGIETISTIVTGIYFAYVAYRGNSFWPAFIIHLVINIFFVYLVNLG